MEDTLVEQVKTVARGPLESVHLSMLEESRHVFPSISIVFKLLKEAAHANNHVLALELRAANSVQLKHVAPFD